MTGPSWTAHEAAFLAWLRLRACLGQTLGWPAPREVTVADVARAAERPPALAQCSGHCLRRIGPALQSQGQAVADDQARRWTLPAPSPTSLEACWNLLPGFHDRWHALWDLRALEDQWGTAAFGVPAAVALLAGQEAQAQRSPHHRRRRGASSGPSPEGRLKSLEAEGWLQPAASGLRLSPEARNALTLFRLVLSGRYHVAPGAIDAIGRVLPRRP